jgi:hypothetical protein
MHLDENDVDVARQGRISQRDQLNASSALTIAVDTGLFPQQASLGKVAFKSHVPTNEAV